MNQILLDYKKRITCRICSSSDIRSVLDLGNQPLANNLIDSPDPDDSYYSTFPLELVVCNDCGLLQLRHTVYRDLLFDDYLYETGTSTTLRNHFSQLADTVKEYIPRFHKTYVLEIGSNDGTFLEECKKRNILAVGVEPCERFKKDYEEKGLNAVYGYFDDEDCFQRVMELIGSPHVIVASNVMAHVSRLRNIMNNVYKVLRPGGIFICEVQDARVLIEEGLFDMIYHEHLFYYEPEMMKTVFDNNKMELIKVEEIPTHGGSIRATYRKMKASAFYQRSDINPTITWQKLEDFKLRIENIKSVIEGILKNAKEDGKIIGFGAPAKATVMCNYFDIRKYIDFTLEENQSKVGKYIPVIDTEPLEIKSFDEFDPSYANFIFIFAWNYAEEIMKKCKDKGFKGKFIVPFSERILYE